MAKWNYTVENQDKIYNLVYQKLKNFDFFQNLNFYVLPYLPEKFRSRVIYLPRYNNKKKQFNKNRRKVEILQKEWLECETEFMKKLRIHFPDLDTINIYVEPSIYGVIGSYETKYIGSVYIYPRTDRKLIDVQKLLINALTHYFYFNPSDDMNTPNEKWGKKQEMAKNIQEQLFPTQKYRSMTQILNRQFSGNLAEESIKYLQELGFLKLKELVKPNNLTKNESLTFDLLFDENKNKLVTFDQIADCIWKDKSEEKYSEYAITKLIERLKKKLPKNVIHVQRSIGYVLISS